MTPSEAIWIIAIGFLILAVGAGIVDRLGYSSPPFAEPKGRAFDFSLDPDLQDERVRRRG